MNGFGIGEHPKVREEWSLVFTHFEKWTVWGAVEEQNNRSQRSQNSYVCKLIIFEVRKRAVTHDITDFSVTAQCAVTDSW